MKPSLYFVSQKREKFWNTDLNALVNYDFRNLSQDQNMIVLFKQGSILKRTTPRRYRLFNQHLFYFRENGEIGGFIVLKNVYCAFKSKDNYVMITLSHHLQQVSLQSGPKDQDLEQFIRELKLNCIQEIDNSYALKNKIGEGITSEVRKLIFQVYEAWTQDNQKVAIKKVLKAIPQSKMREKQAKSLAEEIYIMRSLDHPNIPKLYEVFEKESKKFVYLDEVELVMTFYEGGTLMEKIQNFGLIQRQQLIRSILETVNYIHSKGILHRDLKPANIIYKNKDPCDNDIAVIDFGFATNQKYTEHTLYNCGTPGYAAPEVQEYKEKQKMYSTQCDVYSLGIIIYEIFYGPMKSSSSGNLIFSENVKIPSSLKNLIIQMTRQNPKYRFTLKECLDQDFFKDNFEVNYLDDLLKYSLVDSVYQKPSVQSRKNSIEHSIHNEKKGQKQDFVKGKTNSNSESKNLLQRSLNPYDSQLHDLQFNEQHNFPNDFENLLQKRV